MTDKSTSPFFAMIDDALVNKWETKLMTSICEYTKLTASDINLDDYDLTYANIKTIQNDCDRTRIKERIHLSSFGDLLEKLLVYYCKLNGIEYKQGMNEIMAPFIFLKAKIDISVPRILNLFSCFLDTFLTNYYYEPDLYAFRSSVSLLTLLLKYHDSTLYNIFEKSSISPQMYATNWLLTTYANKHSLDIVYKLWDILIEEDDQLLIHFLVIAFLQFNRKNFLDNDFSMIPMLFSRIKINSLEELNAIVMLAKKIRDNTPYSFRILVNKLEIFKPRSRRLKELYEKFNTEEMISLPILPSEIAYYEYEHLGCADNLCKNFIKNSKDDLNVFECYFCKKHIEMPKKNILLIDLRINPETKSETTTFDEGTIKLLSNKIILNQKELTADNVGERLLKEILQYKEKTHIILLTNDTSYFNEYEAKFYHEKKSEKERNIMLCGYINKLQKELNEKEVKDFVKKDKTHRKRMQLKEYENIKQIISALLENEFSYVSYVLGGFKTFHEIALKYKLPLINHNEEKCNFCLSDKTKNETIDCYSKLFLGKPNSQPNLTTPSYVQNMPVVPRSESVMAMSAKTVEQNTNENVKVDTFTNPIESLPVEDFNKYLMDKSIKVFHCLLKDHNLHIYNEKIMTLIFADCVKFFKMKVGDGKVSFDLLDIAENASFKSIKREEGNVFGLYYANESGNHDVKIDLFSDADADNFNEIVKNIKKD